MSSDILASRGVGVGVQVKNMRENMIKTSFSLYLNYVRGDEVKKSIPCYNSLIVFSSSVSDYVYPQ